MSSLRSYKHMFLKRYIRGYFRLKLSPTSGRCPWWLIFSKTFFYQKNCKEAMNIGGGQKTGSKLILIENSTILMDNIKINGIPTSNESMKNTPFLHCISSFLKVLPIKICKISTRFFISCFILVFPSADIIFHKYLELHSTLFEKRFLSAKVGIWRGLMLTIWTHFKAIDNIL